MHLFRETSRYSKKEGLSRVIFMTFGGMKSGPGELELEREEMRRKRESLENGGMVREGEEIGIDGTTLRYLSIHSKSGLQDRRTLFDRSTSNAADIKKLFISEAEI